MVRRSIGAICVLLGGIWFLQGIGVIRSQSFMTDNATWIWIGLAVAAAGVALIVWPRRSSGPGRDF